MKSLIRNTAINALGIFLLTSLLSGVKVEGGLFTLILGGLIFSVISFVLKPIIGIISLPLNIITFGTFSFLANALILYLLTVFIPLISVKAFVFPGYSFAGFIIPQVSLNTLFAYIVSSLILSITVSVIKWLVKK